ncbi:MAG: phosphoribosyl-AMP cyclohydrolase [Nitrososphaeria archaeon]
MKIVSETSLEDLKFNEYGLAPVVVQDYVTREVLMFAYANKEAITKTAETGFAHFWSRSRKKLWLKGETSGNLLEIAEVRIDCDYDTILYIVEPYGPTCHTGMKSCFHNKFRNTCMVENKYEQEVVSEIISYYEKAKIIKRKWVKDPTKRTYEFILNGITEHVPPPNPRVITWIANKINSITSDDIDKVVVPESLGIPIGTLVSQIKGKPMTIVRKRPFYSDEYLLEKVKYASGYEKGVYYIYGVKKNDNILIIDDTISTGGTLEALLESFIKNGVRVVDVACIMDKVFYHGSEKIESKFGIKVKSLIKVDKTMNVIKCTLV